MDIYECLGIEHLLMDIPVPREAVLENSRDADSEQAREAFRAVDYISLKVSLNRDEHYLQVMEIGLNTPSHIEQIASIIQKAVKYRILFVFVFRKRYLILWRNFKLTESTEYVYSDSTTYCTDWIYSEILNSEVLWTCKTKKIDSGSSRIVPLAYGGSRKNDDGGMAFFEDIVQNVYRLSGTIINRELISARYLMDWFASHSIGRKVDLNCLICRAILEDVYTIIDDHLFFEADRLAIICSEIQNPNYRFHLHFGRTGRIPMTYFHTIPCPATFEDEHHVVSKMSEIFASDGHYFVQVLLEPGIAADTETVRFETPQEMANESEEQRMREAEYRRMEEEERRLEEERLLEEAWLEEARRIAEEERLAEEAWRKAEEERLAEEAWRKAEEERLAEEARRKAEEERFAEEARRKAEEERLAEEARRKAEEERRAEEARRKAEEERRAEEARRKAEEERRAEEARRKVEEERRAEEARRKAEEARRKAEEEERRRAKARHRAEEVRRKAEEAKRKEEARREAEAERQQAEALRKAEEESRREAARLREEARVRHELEQRAQRRADNRCQHCGGQFKSILGLFARKCKDCGRPKDY